ncbi:DUF1839 family protein [Chelatococcus sp. GCM10030263]|uniref:DUF1839 family protein n=1 Tax=Chelatococcus sp. GCM10030263 TaxID=3273387 RepID=UPI00360B3AE5
MISAIPGLDPDRYARHRLHASERNWPETNCYSDLWIEVLHSRGLVPEASLGFTLTQDFEGDQFTFFKVPAEDLETFYGIRVQELSIFDRPLDHIEEQLRRERLVLIEVDGFHLPDTQGVSYRQTHAKTTIGVNAVDAAAKRLDYFHNAGFFRLEGVDFEALFGCADRPAQADCLPPYVEFVKFAEAAPCRDLAAKALINLRRHMARRPLANPVRAYGERLAEHADWLGARPPGFFHKYAFNTLRQLGANFELLGAHLTWLREQGETGFEGAALVAAEIARDAKMVQFLLARAVARRNFAALDAPLSGIADSWERLMEAIELRLARGATRKVARRAA